jgi:hypothetical protein
MQTRVAGNYNLKIYNLSLFNFGFGHTARPHGQATRPGHTLLKYDLLKYDLLKYDLLKYDLLKYDLLKYDLIRRILSHKQKRPKAVNPGTSSFLFSPWPDGGERYCALGGRLYVASYFTTIGLRWSTLSHV